MRQRGRGSSPGSTLRRLDHRVWAGVARPARGNNRSAARGRRPKAVPASGPLCEALVSLTRGVGPSLPPGFANAHRCPGAPGGGGGQEGAHELGPPAQEAPVHCFLGLPTSCNFPTTSKLLLCPKSCLL